LQAAQIQARAVFKVVWIALVSIAAAALLVLVLSRVETTLQWLATAIFLALALSPAVDGVQSLRIGDRQPPRPVAILAVFVAFLALAFFLVLHVIPPIVEEAEELGSKAPGYVKDFEGWAEDNEQFRELNDKYDLTKALSDQASKIPAHLGDVASEAKHVTVEILEHVLAAITIFVLTFFLLMDGREQTQRLISRLPERHRPRWRRIAERIHGVVKGYVTVNLLSAVTAGLFTWAVLELLGVDLAVPLAVIVAFLDLIPLVGFTIGGLLVAAVAAAHDFPTALIVWVVLFLVYQQLQDRVIQPLLFKNMVQVHPVVAIVAILIGGSVLGVLGAVLAIPVAASIGVVIDEVLGEPGS
jgi:predicted PurR-regulated permease PerM